MSVATAAATTATLALATDGLDSLEHILTAPLDIPRLAWEPLDKEFVIQLYTALRTQTDSEIREGIAYGRRRILDVDPTVATTEAADFFRDVTDRLHKDYAHNYYYMARRFYPIDSMEEPDSDDSDYEEDELEISGKTIVETVRLLAKSKVKDYKSLTNKAVFKYMDLVEM